MCFSATASFTVAAVCAGAGAYSLHKCPAPRYLSLAAIPVIFALHQAIEGVVWLSLGDNTQAAGLWPALFVFIATAFWPSWVPFAIWRSETDPKRRFWLASLMLVGGLVTTAYLFKLAITDTTAHLSGHSVQYTHSLLDLHILFGWIYSRPLIGLEWILIPYAIAVIGSLALSSLPAVRWFAAFVAVALVLVFLLDRHVLVSVWCFFAATGSLLVAIAMRQTHVDQITIHQQAG